MNIKTIFALFSLLSLLSLISCDDDLNSVGGSIQPPGDRIKTATDTISLTAKTVSMRDSVYARTIQGVLGQYEDKLFGTIKSDYLCQFMFPEEAKFSDTFVKIDSTLLVLKFINYQGDSLTPMGLTVYPVDRALPEDFYTNVDPARYSDLSEPLISRAYTVAGSEMYNSSAKVRQITSELGVPFGQKIYDAWKNKIITDDETFNDFFKGMYITTTSGTGNIIDVLDTSIEIHYTKTYVNAANVTRDTVAVFSIAVTPEVIQLNHIKNKNPEELFIEGTDATYLKTPAGVYTEVTFPVSTIAQNMEKANMSTINSALFSVKGYTEKEDVSDFSLGRPEALLLIPKDSIDSFFKGRKRPYPYDMTKNYVFLASSKFGSVANNIYSFGNISPAIKAYKDKNVDKITYAIIPVKCDYTYNSYGYAENVLAVYHDMVPSTAILRNDPKNVRLELVYSKF